MWEGGPPRRLRTLRFRVLAKAFAVTLDAELEFGAVPHEFDDLFGVSSEEAARDGNEEFKAADIWGGVQWRTREIPRASTR